MRDDVMAVGERGSLSSHTTLKEWGRGILKTNKQNLFQICLFFFFRIEVGEKIRVNPFFPLYLSREIFFFHSEFDDSLILIPLLVLTMTKTNSGEPGRERDREKIGCKGQRVSHHSRRPKVVINCSSSSFGAYKTTRRPLRPKSTATTKSKMKTE